MVEDVADRAARATALNAFITLVSPTRAERGPLAGWTVAVKDLIDVVGLPTTAGGLPTTVARRDSAVVRRLRSAGVAVTGKTNMDEWGLGVTGRNAKWGDCINPWDEARLTGGSSSGSAVSVAAGLATIGLGTDTAGSLRIPAAFCGVTALKPGSGVVPTNGVLGLAASLDCVGVLARSVAECARAHATISAPRGSRSGYRRRGRVGIPRGEHWESVDDDVATAIEATGRVLERTGQILVDVDVPAIAEATRLSGTVLLYEVAHRHGSRWSAARRSSLEPRVARQLQLGAAISHGEYSSALAFRDRWRVGLAEIFGDVDVLLHPTTPGVAGLRDEHAPTALLTRMTAAWNLADLPVLAFQAGTGKGGMPIGGSLVGPDGGETLLFDIGVAFQRATDWHLRIPATMDPASDGGAT